MAVGPVSKADKNNTDGSPETSDGQSGTFEDVYEAMGPPGRFQILQIAMILTMTTPMVFVNIKYVFISIENSFQCAKVNETVLLTKHIEAHNHSLYHASYNQSCDIGIFKNESGKINTVKTIDCPLGYDFVGGDDVSFISEWGLVCDKAGTPELAQTVVAVGGFLGQVLTNVIADKYGRWGTITISIVLTVFTEIATSYAPDIYALICLRFLSGVVSAGIYICGYVLPFEFIVEKYRLIFAMVAGVTWSLSVLVLCGVAYAFQDWGWRDFQLYSSIMCVLPIIFMYFIYESPSWLHSVGQKERSEKIIRHICKTNKVDYEQVVKDKFEKCFEEIQIKSVAEDDEVKIKSNSALDLFRSRKLLLIVIYTWFASFTNELTNNGLYLTASNLAGDLYLNMSLLGLISTPAYIVSYVCLLYKGRRFVIVLFTVMSGVSLLISPFIANANIDGDVARNLSLMFFVLGKFAISAGYNTLYMYIPELFPTNLRASGMGISTTGVFLGGALAPYLLPFSKIASWAPGVALASCCLITSLLFTKLPETRGKKLTATLDVENDKPITKKSEKSTNVLYSFENSKGQIQ